LYTMKSDYGQAILSLCVSDRNKALLLTCEVFIPLLVDSLLLDPAHPRINDTTLQGKSDWEGAKAPVQRVRHAHVHHPPRLSDQTPLLLELLLRRLVVGQLLYQQAHERRVGGHWNHKQSEMNVRA